MMILVSRIVSPAGAPWPSSPTILSVNTMLASINTPSTAVPIVRRFEKTRHDFSRSPLTRYF